MIDAGKGFPVKILVQAPALVRRRSFMHMEATLQVVFRNARAYDAHRHPGEVARRYV